MAMGFPKLGPKLLLFVILGVHGLEFGVDLGNAFVVFHIVLGILEFGDGAGGATGVDLGDCFVVFHNVVCGVLFLFFVLRKIS